MKKLFLNTIHRYDFNNSLSSNCQVPIPGGIKAKRYRVDNVILWNFIKPFSNSNNQLSFSVQDATVEDYILAIDETKNYNSSQLITELTNKFNALKAGLVSSIVYDDQTGYLTFNFSLPVRFNSNLTTCQFKLSISNLLDGSFSSTITTGILAHQTKQIFLSLGFSGVKSKNTNSQLQNSILAIPLINDFGGIITFSPSNPVEFEGYDNNLNSLNIQLLDANGSIVEYPEDLTVELTLY